MSKRSTHHATFVIERDYAAPPAHGAAVQLARLRQHAFRVEVREGVHDRLALRDALRAGARQRLGGELAARHAFRGSRRAQFVEGRQV
jgi:hypothetical protein